MPKPSNQIREMFQKGMAALGAGNSDLAETHFRQILSINNALPEVHFQLGRVEMQRRRPAKALAHFARAQRLRPLQPEIWVAAVEAHLARNDRKAAKKLRQKAILAGLPAAAINLIDSRISGAAPAADGAPAANAVLKQAYSLYKAGQFTQARSSLKAYLDSNSANAQILTLLGATKTATGHVDEAIEDFRAATKIDPDYAVAQLQLGEALLRTQRLDEARQPLSEALRLTPESPLANKFMGMLAAHRFQHRIARQRLEKAHEALGDDAEVLYALAQLHLEENRPEQALDLLRPRIDGGTGTEAEFRAFGHALLQLDKAQEALAAFEQALKLDPDSLPAHRNITMAFQALGDFESAARHAESVFDADIYDGILFTIYARGKKLRPTDELAVKMHAAYDEHRELPGTRAQLSFALAKIEEDAGNKVGSFTLIRAGNEQLRNEYPVNLDSYREEFQRTKALVEKGLPPLSGNTPADPAITPIVVSGLPRSGTTLVEQILASHSKVTAGGELNLPMQVFSRTVDLIHAEGRPIAPKDLRQIGQEITGEYQRLFPGARYLTDKGLSAYHHLGLLKRAVPQCKIIIVRRDPRDNCLSMYKNLFQPGTYRYTTDLVALGEYYLHYLEILDFWRATCPEAFHEVHYEDLIADPATHTRTLIAACELEWDDNCLAFHKTERQVRNLSVFQVRQPIYSSSVGAWKPLEKELGPLIEVLKKGGALRGLD